MPSVKHYVDKLLILRLIYAMTIVIHLVDFSPNIGYFPLSDLPDLLEGAANEPAVFKPVRDGFKMEDSFKCG